MVGRVLEQHLDELPVDEAVIHREDVEPRLGIDHRHGRGTAVPASRVGLFLAAAGNGALAA